MIPVAYGYQRKTDPYMMVTQGGIKGNLTEKVYYKAGLTWYDVNNPNHLIFGEGLGINSTSTGPGGASILKYNFNNVIVEGADIGINDPFGELLPSPIYIPQIGVFGDYRTKSMPPEITKIKPGRRVFIWEIPLLMAGEHGRSSLIIRSLKEIPGWISS